MKALLRRAYRGGLDMILPERWVMRGFMRRQLPATGARLVIEVGAASSPYARTLAECLPGLWHIRSDLLPSEAVVVADVQALPFRSGCADLLLASHVLQYPPNLDQALAEIHRVLRPGGHVLVICPFLTITAGISDRRRWTMKGLAETFEAAGFTPVASQPVGGVFTGLAELAAQLLVAIGTKPDIWRSSGDTRSLLRLALATLLGLPFHLLGLLGLLLDRWRGPSGMYVAMVMLAQRQEKA